MRNCLVGVAAALAVTVGMTGAANSASYTLYDDRTAFETALDSSTMIVDGFDAAGYAAGDTSNSDGFDIHSDSSMSAVLGEADFRSTGFNDWNLITQQTTNATYCAGCNGSFEVGFTTTSVGSSAGVFGVGVDVVSSSSAYFGLVTFGDGSTEEIWLDAAGFYGITSDQLITSVQLGITSSELGIPTSDFIWIDNMIYGAQGDSAVVPLPATLPLLAGALIAGAAFARRRS